MTFATLSGRVAGLDHIWQVCVTVAIRMQHASLLFRSLKEYGSQCWGQGGYTAGTGKNGVPTHTLDHHGATPIGGLGPAILFYIMDYHGADAVCVPITATGEKKVMRPTGPACHPSATRAGESRPSAFSFNLYLK